MSNLFKPPATDATPAPGNDFATRWDAIGSRLGAAPRDFPEAKARYGGLPNGPRLAAAPRPETTRARSIRTRSGGSPIRRAG